MFERLGGTQTLKVDVRIIAATNRSLEDCVNKGTFRADLYYRLNVVPVILPPLCKRREDITLLLDHFLKESNKMNNRQVRLSSSVVQFLCEYRWPGNVRELQNLLERLVIMADDNNVRMSDLPSVMTAEPEAPQALPHLHHTDIHYAPVSAATNALPTTSDAAPCRSLKEIEREQVIAALKRHGWIQARAARELGLTQRQIGYRIKRHNIAMPAISY